MEKQKTYFERESIKSVECDICKKTYNNAQSIVEVKFEVNTFIPEQKYLISTDFENECLTLHLCYECLLKFKGVYHKIDSFIANSEITLGED